MRSTRTIWTRSWSSSPRTVRWTCRGGPNHGAGAWPARRPFVRAWPPASRDCRMSTTAMAGIGSAAISASPSGCSPARPPMASRCGCADAITGSSAAARSSARTRTGRSSTPGVVEVQPRPDRGRSAAAVGVQEVDHPREMVGERTPAVGRGVAGQCLPHAEQVAAQGVVDDAHPRCRRGRSCRASSWLLVSGRERRTAVVGGGQTSGHPSQLRRTGRSTRSSTSRCSRR